MLPAVDPRARSSWEEASREPIATRIRAAIEAHTDNVSELARDFGVAPNTLYRICNGENLPSIHLLWQIARATGKPMDWFVSGEEAPAEPALVSWAAARAARNEPVPPAAMRWLRGLTLYGASPTPVFYDLALVAWQNGIPAEQAVSIAKNTETAAR